MGKHSHLFDFHAAHAKITEFGGFDMPLWYEGIIEEHNAVRNAAGIFDVSHMGRFKISGNEATQFLDRVLPSNVQNVKEGRAFYSALLNQDGGIIDDTVTNKISPSEYIMVVNAANRDKDLHWLLSKKSSFDCEVDDFSDNSALIAIQGPHATRISQKLSSIDLRTLKRYSFAFCDFDEESALVSRTGYTGEDGIEVAILETKINSPEKALKVWNDVLNSGQDEGLKPCGLGARDSLRLEAGMCLYGQDMDESTTPLEASLDSIVDLQKQTDFFGRATLEKQARDGTVRRRVPFVMTENGIPRHGYNVTLAGSKIGIVTSGTFSPTTRKGIGMAYVPNDLSKVGDHFSIDLRGQSKTAEVVNVPFYDTTRFGYKRKQAS